MGADSLTAVKFQLLLKERLDLDIPIGEVFQYPSPQALAQQTIRRSNPDPTQTTDDGIKFPQVP